MKEGSELYCPYCGDDLIDQDELAKVAAYAKEHGKCYHWDREE